MEEGNTGAGGEGEDEDLSSKPTITIRFTSLTIKTPGLSSLRSIHALRPRLGLSSPSRNRKSLSSFFSSID